MAAAVVALSSAQAGVASAAAGPGRAGHAPTATVRPAASAGPAGDYLALGDSVPFGFNPLLPLPSDPAGYVGYPELVARRAGLSLTNLSCPGQTSGSFLSLTAADNGCFLFRSIAPLHTPYAGTQLQAALAFLTTHPDTRLVTLMLGSNDLLLCRKTTADGCTDPHEVATTLAGTARHLVTVLAAIRHVYHGQLVVVTYYSPDFADPTLTLPIRGLDALTTLITRLFAGTVADGFTPFRERSAAYAGSPCAAGLLIALPTGTCDIHPSPAGAELLAQAVIVAAGKTKNANT